MFAFFMPILYTEEEIKTAACAKACGNEEIMAIKADYHLHSAFSGDGRASMDEMIQKCYDAGLQNVMDEFTSQYNTWLETR